ncbi:hypothetical protein KAZ82_00845 [Candidatus Babeliales bacterium]|nr:hypothetical protein [Candidatus Babeliales bacterium]
MKHNKIYSIIFFTLLIGHKPCDGASFLVDLGGKVLATGMKNATVAVVALFIYHQLRIHFQAPLEKDIESLKQFCQGGLNDVNTMFETVKEQTEALAKSHQETLNILQTTTNPNASTRQKLEEEKKKADELLVNIQQSRRIVAHKVPVKGCFSCC